MPKSKTPIGEQIDKTKSDIKQSENHLKMLLQKKNNFERNARTRRLIECGAILESLIDGALNLTNEQIKTLLQSALCTASARETAASFISGNNTKITGQGDASPSAGTD
jgi:hypothetical protein